MPTTSTQGRTEPGILSRVPALFRRSVVFVSRDGSTAATVTILITTPGLWRNDPSRSSGSWVTMDLAALVLAVKLDWA